MPDSPSIAVWSNRMRRLLVPSLADVFFGVLLLVAVARPGGWQALLADGDTGWHIRTGELVWRSGQAPTADPFSFTLPGHQWFAWEWLSDTVFAAAFTRRGIAAVAVLAGVVLCLAAAILFAWLLRRGAGLWLGLAVTLAAVSASTVHYLARPHIFSILLYTVSLWILDEVRQGRRRLLWLLPPLCALWANLHAGFVALPATLLLSAAVETLRREFPGARRYGLAALLCLAASCANPYGWRLHQHIAAYLNAPWIMDHVQEFQSPNIRSEGMVVFAILLLAGVSMASRSMARGQWTEGALVLVWGFAALRSARHIPFFAIAAAPVVASECALWWRRAAESAPVSSVRRMFWELGEDLGRRPGLTLWIPLVAAAALAAAPRGTSGFPENRFPVRAVEANTRLLAPGSTMPRILTSDQWSDYLIFRLYPKLRVFFDGRSDFYGARLGADYRVLMGASQGWRELLGGYRFELALLPRDWALSTMLDREPGWRRLYEDRLAVLYGRDTGVAP